MRYREWLSLALAGVLATACETISPTEPGNLVPRTVAEDASLPFVQMNGSRFHVQTFGNPANPAIIFLHGGPGGDYRSMLRMSNRYDGYSLVDQYFLVYWDQRGAGLSQRHNRDLLTEEVYVNDLNALASLFSPGRPVYLIGESWGAMFATRYVNQYPGRVAGAVLIEAGPLNGVTMERLKNEVRDFDLRAEWLNDALWSSQFFTPDNHARMDYERMLGMNVGQRRFHLSETDPEQGWRQGAAAARYLMEDAQDNNGVFNYDFTTNLAAYTTPVLFVAGGLSEVLGESLQQEQVLLYPSASLKVVNGAGHDVAWVKTAEVVTHIRSYLNARGNNQ